jgi:hypothetical protein
MQIPPIGVEDCISRFIGRLAYSEPSSAIHVSIPSRRCGRYADLGTLLRARPVAVHHHPHLPPPPLSVSALLLDPGERRKSDNMPYIPATSNQ